MEGAFVKALRVDSRFRKEGGTSSDFAVELPQTIEFPPDTRGYVSAMSAPHSWWNVEAHQSDRLHVIESRTVAGTPEVLCRRVVVPEGYYTSLTLPGAIAAALNAGKLWPTMAYDVQYVSSKGFLRIQLVATGATDATARFRLPSEDELLSATWRAANWTGEALRAGDLDTMGDLLRLPPVSAPTTAMDTGLLDASPLHVLYLKSNITAFDTLGPRGESDIIQRIPVTEGYGYVIHYAATGASEEFFTVGRGQLRELRFQLHTVNGKPVNLHGGQVSIELTFERSPV